jgi:hypothetical protein
VVRLIREWLLRLAVVAMQACNKGVGLIDHGHMAAECAIDDCGVLAVGRCIECSKAFCRSHQAMDGGVAWVNKCSACRDRRQAVVLDQASKRAEIESYVRNRATAELEAAGAPAVDVLKVETTYVKRFGGRRRQEVIASYGRGWLLGRYKWWYVEYGMRGSETERSAEFETVLMAPGHGWGGAWPDARSPVVPTIRDLVTAELFVPDGHRWQFAAKVPSDKPWKDVATKVEEILALAAASSPD